MIPRTLVPTDVRPVTQDEARKAPRRLTTYMDDRTVVPSGLSEAPPLDGKTEIPAHLPLGVLVDRTLVPRGMPANVIERFEPVTERFPVAILDSRVVVPAYVEPLTDEESEELEHAPEMTAELREIVQPDILTTGDANLLIEQEEKRDPKSDLVTRVLSVAVHIALIVFLIFSPKIFPTHVPTQEEIASARKQLQWIYSPPEVPVPPAPTPKIHVNPETLNKIAPPVVQPQIPAPPVTPEKPPSDLPEAPRPQIRPIPQQAQPAPATAPPAPSHLEPVLPSTPNANRLNLQLPQSSPGKLLSDQLDDAIRHGRNPGSVYSGGPAVPGSRGLGMGYVVQILSDTQGVDFSNYITRLLAALKRNWEAVMPESARMGDRGVVFTTFQINPDGSVPSPDPMLERTSGKEPLDNAAMSAIHASNPFEPLPSQFHGPFLRLRIAFIYNIPPEQVNLR
ncbi:MAG TPA: TonB C-terminal domain-containing protein [Candidatus Acidoferrales bacterium]|nr:TonB C-terminal domain-containing protein [Candidatus Acidoferrales bacterium]